MKRIRQTLDFKTVRPTVITLGKFDGVHRGHTRLIRRIIEIGEKDDLETVIFTFDVAPQIRLGQRSAQQLLTNGERSWRLEAEGIDLLIECPFVPEIMQMEAEEFVRSILVERLHAKALVVGPDFRFGHGRKGTLTLLAEMGKRYGFTLEVLEKVRDEDREISSTYIREELTKGHMDKAARLLGYPYYITGTVVKGQQLGRTIQFPTLNQIPAPEKLLPPFGVYASRIRVDGQEYDGITNIGMKPTVGGNFVGAETHLFDYTGDLYGKEVCVQLYHFQRPEQKFASLDALKGQLQKDVEAAREYFGSVHQHFT